MKLKFTKMQGLGNDFVVFNGITQHVDLQPQQLRAIADRHFGVGCDQILLVERPSNGHADFRYRIFNADGNEVEHCGNGARCFVRFVRQEGLTDKTEIAVQTVNGLIRPSLQSNGEVRVDMGVPRFEPQDIPFEAPARSETYPLEVAGTTIEVSALSMGNPHAVQLVADVDRAPVTSLGPLIERHPRFPARVNAGFLQVLDRRNVKLRVWERGSGETLACGTGACAAVVAGISRGLLDGTVAVATRGGVLTIEWAGIGTSVFMTGEAQSVFSGEIEIN